MSMLLASIALTAVGGFCVGRGEGGSGAMVLVGIVLVYTGGCVAGVGYAVA